MSLTLCPDPCIKFKQINYQENAEIKKTRSRNLGKNPIKVVVDMIGEDGEIHQKIINQVQQTCNVEMKLRSFRSSKSFLKSEKRDSTTQKVKDKKTSGSFVFNRFSYDNYRQIPVEKRIKTKSSNNFYRQEGRKNIEIVFCQNKLPQFVNKTNQKIENLFRKEQIKDFTHKNSTFKQVGSLSSSHDARFPLRKSQKTNLASCLKEYATLQKLSLFMENDQRRREQCICYQLQRDPTRNLLLDIITHRFSFLKKMSKRGRDWIYSSLLGREINSLTKINIHEYMKLSEMFVGRDASPLQVATFMYIFLFGNEVPTIERVQDKLEMINGHLNKLRTIFDELCNILSNENTEDLVDVLAKRGSLLRLFIDYIIEKD